MVIGYSHSHLTCTYLMEKLWPFISLPSYACHLYRCRCWNFGVSGCHNVTNVIISSSYLRFMAHSASWCTSYMRKTAHKIGNNLDWFHLVDQSQFFVNLNTIVCTWYKSFKHHKFDCWSDMHSSYDSTCNRYSVLPVSAHFYVINLIFSCSIVVVANSS